MRYELNRTKAYDANFVYPSHRIVENIQEKLELPIDLIEDLLGAWIGIVHSAALQNARKQPRFFSSVVEGDGHGFLRLSSLLVPEGWKEEDFFKQITSETGTSIDIVIPVIHNISKILFEIKGQQAFEPIGWFEPSKDADNPTFLVYLWEDFFRPVSTEPLDYGIEVGSSANLGADSYYQTSLTIRIAKSIGSFLGRYAFLSRYSKVHRTQKVSR